MPRRCQRLPRWGPMGAMPPPSPTSFAPPMDVIRRVAFENQVPAEDVYGIAKTESGFNPNARSPKGAVGRCSCFPAPPRTWASWIRTTLSRITKAAHATMHNN